MDSLLFVLTPIVSLILLGVSVYVLILFIMLARRGIKALDIYIDEKRNKNL